MFGVAQSSRVIYIHCKKLEVDLQYPFRADSGYIRATNVVPFCGFLLESDVQQRTDDIAGNLLVGPLPETVVIRAG